MGDADELSRSGSNPECMCLAPQSPPPYPSLSLASHPCIYLYVYVYVEEGGKTKLRVGAGMERMKTDYFRRSVKKLNFYFVLLKLYEHEIVCLV